MSTLPPLRHDIETLNGLLERVIAEQAGEERLSQFRQLRQLARERRVGVPGAEARLAERIRELSEDEIRSAVRGLSLYFDLANLAEDLQRVRVLRERERSTTSRPESVGDAVAKLKQAGVTAEQMQQLLDRLCIDLVFTAHPTEAKRRTTRRVLRQLRQELHAAQSGHLLPGEVAEVNERLLTDMTLLWQVDPIRPQRPTVMNEVERGLFFFDGLWETLPKIQSEMRRALAEHYPGHVFRRTPFVKFGSWIGGDRDGNPFVTAEVTATALERLRRVALDKHLATCRALSHLLVMSDRLITVSDPVRKALSAACSRWSSLKKFVETVSEVEVYRRWLRAVEFRLEASLAAGGSASDGPAYRSGAELLTDVELLAASLRGHHGERIVAGYLAEWLDQIATFGLQFAALDVRQDSRVHVEVMAEVFKSLGLCPDYAAADEAARQSLLLKPPTIGNELFQYSLSDMTRETLSLFKLLARVVRSQGLDALGGHVISMTNKPSDVLTVLWLWQWAWRATPGDAVKPLAYLPIVPLFETIGDLQHGPEILEQLLAIPAYRAYLSSGCRSLRDGSHSENASVDAPTQIIMVGYSDSTKDGGYLAASWGLFRAQENLAASTAKQGVRLVVFHGRGGALGRGGGPAARAILSLPPASVGGSLRMTEQGEVLAERYDDPQIARRHLEQVTWATMLVSGRPPEPTPDAWPLLLDRLAARSFTRYRQLVEDPNFLAYFDQATPISDIEQLPIGSRPSRRRARRSLSDLRAIPWTFAWTQCRHFLPAWFGLGTAILEAVNEENGDWSEFQTMYDQWPAFTATIDNAVLALSKADLSIGQRYADLMSDRAAADSVWSLIRDEFDQSRAAVLMITREPSLLAGTPWLQQSIQERNPYVDPLNLIQVELIRRMRAAVEAGREDEAERLRELTRLTIQGVAAGLRTTG